MRLFIAVPLPPGPQAETVDVLHQLRRRDWPVRWVRDEGIHITLKFFGETSVDRVDAIGEMMNYAARGMRAMTMSLHGAGVFPNAERPRVLHLGVDAGADLELLQDRIERGGEQLGFQPEGRLFRPHITLERITPGQPFLADQVVLYESQLSSDGPSYAIRHQVTLG